MTEDTWTPSSWRQKTAKQQPTYADHDHLEDILNKIKGYPPLVFAGEVTSLKRQLAAVGRGQAFLLQGGDCAERFVDCSEASITAKFKILLQMSVVLCYGLRRPVVRVGRIAGQYAKPRSADFENHGDKKLPVYRGDSVNGYEPNDEARAPDPKRLLRSYHLSALTLNYLRALAKGGFSDLHHPESWNLGFVSRSSNRKSYESIVEAIGNAIGFVESLTVRSDLFQQIDFYTSHEGLLLGYEQALTRHVPFPDTASAGFYNLGAHLLWIGDRTRDLDGAHIEYFRGIENPIGLKVGPSMKPDDLVDACRILNPSNELGKLLLITRFGQGRVDECLPKMLKAVSASRRQVVWSVDPMHGNGIKTESDIKTRDFDAILDEWKKTFEIHRKYDSYLGGVHFELTGEDVTECIGGSDHVSIADLSKRYETFCDPRLNYSQSLEMSLRIASLFAREHEGL